jgi:DNA-binding response OmpR family regulator
MPALTTTWSNRSRSQRCPPVSGLSSGADSRVRSDLVWPISKLVRRIVTRGGRRIDLRPKEYALLEFLMRNSDRPVTRSLIIEHVWDIHFDSISNVVEVHINALRNKIDRDFSVPLIHTVRGVGYMLSDKAP